MIPTKTKEEITNGFFNNFVSSCLSVLDSALSVDIILYRRLNKWKNN